MRNSIPLGEKESQRLEFKSADALKKPETIGREVVAMLNAEGGEIWVGLRDEDERATSIERIPDADREGRRLWDYLVDAIEPPPIGGEVAIEPCESGAGTVLQVAVSPQPSRRPYALFKAGGRFFVTRVGARIRPMTRQEILHGESSLQVDYEAAIQQVIAEQVAFEEKLRTRGVLWLRLQPTEKLELDFRNLKDSDLLTDPTRTGNRRVGSNFTAAATLGGRSPELKRTRGGTDAIVIGKEDVFNLEIYRDGGILFTAPLAGFWSGKAGLLWPLDPLEYTVSICRLASKLLSDPDLCVKRPHGGVALVAHLGLFGLGGWSLRPGSPNAWGFPWTPQAKVFEREDFILDRPLVFTAQEIEADHDYCGFRLLLRLYEAFGFSEEDFPKEFDQKSGRLILPE